MNLDENLTIHTLWDDLGAVVRRRKALVGWVALSTMVAVYVGLGFVSDQYEAHASLLVTLGRENSEVPVTVERGSVFSDGIKKEEVNSYIVLMTSQNLIEAAIKEVGLERFEYRPDQPKGILAQVKSLAKRGARWSREQMDEALIRIALRPRLSQREQVRLKLERSLNVYREKDASVISLSLRLSDAILARDVLEALTRKYLEQHAQVVRQGNSVVPVFEEQARLYSERIGALRQEAVQRKAQLGVSSVAEQKSQLMDMLKVAELGKQERERELVKYQTEQAALQELRPRLQEQVLSTTSINPSIPQTKAKEILAELQLQQAQALAKYETNADPVIKIDQQIARVQSLLSQVPREDDGPKTYLRNPIVSSVDSQLQEDGVRIRVLEAELEKIESQMVRIKNSFRRLDGAETELQKLQLEINVAEARFLSSASKREEARTQETMDRQRVANVAMLSPPAYSEKPVSPKRLLVFGLGIVAGLLAGLGLALFMEWQSDLVYDATDLDRISPGLCLGVFPANSPETSPRRQGS